MPDPETLDTRKRKRIIEVVISQFPNADGAVQFGRMVNKGVKERVYEEVTVKAGIANPEGVIAITKEWIGPTVLKLTFLDIPDQNTAIFIRDYLRHVVKINNLRLDHELIREKPQPQTITLDWVPSSLKLFNVG